MVFCGCIFCPCDIWDLAEVTMNHENILLAFDGDNYVDLKKEDGIVWIVTCIDGLAIEEAVFCAEDAESTVTNAYKSLFECKEIGLTSTTAQ